MRMNNIATGIAIAVIGAAILAIGVAVQEHRFENENRVAEEQSPDITNDKEAEKPDENWSGGQGMAAYNGSFYTGDVNGDGIINTTDLSDLARYVSDSGTFSLRPDNSDLNEDGKIDVSDYDILKEWFKREIVSG